MKKPKSSAIAVGLVLGFALTLCMATTFDYTLDCASPVGTDAPSSLDDKDRETRFGFAERLNVDHRFNLTGTQLSDADIGMHRQVTFYSSTATDPILGVAAVSSVDELRYTDSEGSVLYLTSDGTLNIRNADLLGTLASNTYFTAVDNAGTGTVDLIKANVSDVAVLPDGSELATTAAPTADADITNKKFVDDRTDGQAATANDSDPTAMLKAHAYLAATSGFVTAFASTDNRMQLYVGATNDPAGAGTLVDESHATNTDRINVHAFVPNGRYFEVTLSSETPTIIWTALVSGGAAPADQD